MGARWPFSSSSQLKAQQLNRTAGWRTAEPNCKNLPKIKFKKFLNLTDHTYLHLQWLNKIWIWKAGTWKRKLCKFAITYMEKLVKSHQVIKFFWRVLAIWSNCVGLSVMTETHLWNFVGTSLFTALSEHYIFTQPFNSITYIPERLRPGRNLVKQQLATCAQREWLRGAVYVAVPKENTEYQYWKHTKVWLFK